MKQPPNWVEILSPTVALDAELAKLEAGEIEAIALAEELSADQLIIDELLGRREAELARYRHCRGASRSC